MSTTSSALVGSGKGGVLLTPSLVRDKLNINTEENMAVGDTPALYKNYQKQLKQNLKDCILTRVVLVASEQILTTTKKDLGKHTQRQR